MPQAVVGGTNAPPVVSGDSVVVTTRSDYELGASGNLLHLHTVDNFGRDEREYHHEFGYVSASGERTLFARDMLGSNRATLRNGVVTDWRDYYCYGAVRDGATLSNGRWLYLGKEFDGETATLHLDAREYDPFVGFTQIDLLGLIPSLQGYSPYIYTRNNPLTRKDPRGLADDDWFQKLYKTISDFIAGGGPMTVRDTPTAQEVARNKSEPINKAGEVLGGLSMVAKSVSDEANKAVKAAPRNLVKAGIKVSDDVSDASTMVAGLGIMAIPVTFGESLTGTAFAMTVGTAADVTSAALKATDYFFFDGTREELVKAVGKVGVGIITDAFLGGLPESGLRTLIKFSIETPSNSAIDGKLNKQLLPAR